MSLRLLHYALRGACSGGTNTQDEWAKRRAQTWGAMPPPPPPPPVASDNGNDCGASALADSLGEVAEIAANANVYLLHGGWMAATWSTVALAGIFIARYCRHIDGWIEWHIKCQAVAAMGTCGFVAVAISMVHEQLAGAHQQLGFVIGVWTLFQASAGDFIHQQPPGPARHQLLTWCVCCAVESRDCFSDCATVHARLM